MLQFQCYVEISPLCLRDRIANDDTLQYQALFKSEGIDCFLLHMDDSILHLPRYTIDLFIYVEQICLLKP